MARERNILKMLSNEQCFDAFKEAFDTAAKHKESAESIAKNGQYGMGISHLILGIEELVKGLLFRIQSLDIDVRNVPGIHLFFTDHILKHQFATDINMMYVIIKPFMGIINKMKEDLHNPESNIEYTDTEKAIISKDEKRIHAVFRNLPEMIDWWDEANIMKNKGFYVDYTTRLETPMQVEAKEYIQAVEITEIFKSQIFEFIAYFDRLTDEEKKEAAKNAKKYNFTNLLVKIIEARKEQKKLENKLHKIKFTKGSR